MSLLATRKFALIAALGAYVAPPSAFGATARSSITVSATVLATCDVAIIPAERDALMRLQCPVHTGYGVATAASRAPRAIGSAETTAPGITTISYLLPTDDASAILVTTITY